MTEMRRSLLTMLVAVLLVTPAGIVAAQPDGTGDEAGNETPEADGNDSDGNETAANASDGNETEANESDDEDDERDRDRAPSSSFDRENDTFTGDHVAFTIDEALPGIRDYTILDGDNTTVFSQVTLPVDDGNDTQWSAQRDVFVMETDQGELMLRDTEAYELGVDADDGNATLTVADGVNVTLNETFSDENESEALYELHLDGNRTLYLSGDELTFDNGTFTVADEARLSASFPPGEDRREDAQERHEEIRERAEERREEMREAGSQWDRSNDTLTGDHIAFELNTSLPGILGYRLVKANTTVFDEIALETGDDNDTEWRAHGVGFELRTDDSRLRLLDVPPAVLVIEADDGSPATLTLADGINVTRLSQDADDDNETDDDNGTDEANETDGDADERAVYRLNLTANRSAWLAGEELTFDNDTFTVGDKAYFRSIPAGFEGSPNSGPGSLPDQARADRDDDDDDDDERDPPEHARARSLDRDARENLERAVATGAVGVEVHVSENETEPVALELGHVQVRHARADPKGETKAGLTIAAEHGSPGTVVTLNLNASDLGNLTVQEAADKLGVTFDNETIEPAADLQDVLDWSDDDGTPEYLLLVGGDKVQVLVSVPGFSVHTIEVTSVSTQSAEDTQTNGAPGFGALALVAATGVALTLVAARKED